MSEKEILNLISKHLSDSCTKEERKRIEKWIEEDPLHQRYFHAIQDIWEVKPEQEIEIDFEEECKRIGARLGIDLGRTKSINQQKSKVPLFNLRNEKSSKNSLWSLLRVAAILIFISIPVYYFISFESTPAPVTSERVEMKKIQTSEGERAEMQFSDGSKIILNSMSTVRFPKTFKDSKREIYLKGEAFFKVVHNKKAPFIVHVNDISIQDIGTEFNVNAYEDNQAIKVAVKKGKVSVRQNKLKTDDKRNEQTGTLTESGSEVVLTKGEITSIESGMKPMAPKAVSLIPYLSWVNGRMVFEGDSMGKVIPVLERAYNLKFEVRDSSILAKHLRGSFRKEDPREVLKIIAFSLGIDYKIQGNTVILRLNNRRIQ